MTYPKDRTCHNESCPCHSLKDVEEKTCFVCNREFNHPINTYCVNCRENIDNLNYPKNVELERIMQEFELEKRKFLVFDKQSGSRFLDEEAIKSFITQVYKEAYNEGLSLREAYNDPKLLEKIKEKAKEEERQKII